MSLPVAQPRPLPVGRRCRQLCDARDKLPISSVEVERQFGEKDKIPLLAFVTTLFLLLKGNKDNNRIIFLPFLFVVHFSFGEIYAGCREIERFCCFKSRAFVKRKQIESKTKIRFSLDAVLFFSVILSLSRWSG